MSAPIFRPLTYDKYAASPEYGGFRASHPNIALSVDVKAYSSGSPRKIRRILRGVNCVILRQTPFRNAVTYDLVRSLLRKGFSLSDAQISRFNQRALVQGALENDGRLFGAGAAQPKLAQRHSRSCKFGGDEVSAEGWTDCTLAMRHLFAKRAHCKWHNLRHRRGAAMLSLVPERRRCPPKWWVPF